VCNLSCTLYRHPLPDRNMEVYMACVICHSQSTGIPYQTEIRKSIERVWFVFHSLQASLTRQKHGSLYGMCDLSFTVYRHPLPDRNMEVYITCVICLSQSTGIPYQTETWKSIGHEWFVIHSLQASLTRQQYESKASVWFVIHSLQASLTRHKHGNL